MTDRLELTLPEGVEGSLAMVAAKNPQMFVITVQGNLSPLAILNVRENWKILVMGTPLEHVPVAILPNGTSLQIVDQVSMKPLTISQIRAMHGIGPLPDGMGDTVPAHVPVPYFTTLDSQSAAFKYNPAIVPADSCIAPGVSALAEIQQTKEPYIGLHGDVR